MAEIWRLRWLWAFSIFATLGLLGSRLYLLAAAAVAVIAWAEQQS